MMNLHRIRLALVRLRGLPWDRYMLRYIVNKAHHCYLRLRHARRVAHPSTIMLELTNQCNLACTICPRESQLGKTMDQGQMDLALAKRLIDETSPYLDSIGLTGLGETFLYRHLADLVEYIHAKNRGIRISLSTNAVLPRFLELARPLVGKVDTLQVSIDGLDDVYESIRKKASFAVLDSNLRTLAQWCKGTRTSIELNMVLTKENYTQMLAVASYARQVGVGRLLFAYFNVAATELDNSYYEFYRQEPFVGVFAQLKKMAAEETELEIGLPSVEFNGAIECPYPWNHFYIAWNGELPPCCVKPFPKAFSLGSVKQRALIEVLNGPAYQGFRRCWQQKKVPAYCAKCIV